MLTNPESEDVKVDGQNLSAEAKAVAQEATLFMKQWVDQQLTSITRQTRDELTAAKQSLDATFASLDQAFAETKRSIEGISKAVQDAKLALPDNPKLAKAVADIEAATKAAHDDLERRKELFCTAGTAAAASLGKAVKAFVL